MSYSELELKALKYLPENEPRPIEPRIYERERIAMYQVLERAYESLHEGNPPVAATLINHRDGITMTAKTDDKSTRDLLGHAEIRVLGMMQEYVGDDLSECTLVTAAEPCASCTPHYAEGKIGKVVFAAPRSMIWEIAGIMRPREINFPELMRDGETKTIVVERFMAVSALGMFAIHGRMRGHKLDRDVSQAVRDIYDGKLEEPEIETIRFGEY